MSKKLRFDVFRADDRGMPAQFEASYDTVAEVLAHCEEHGHPHAIQADGRLLTLDEFLEKNAAAG